MPQGTQPMMSPQMQQNYGYGYMYGQGFIYPGQYYPMPPTAAPYGQSYPYPMASPNGQAIAPASPSVHQSPLPSRASTGSGKIHTPIKLIDPVTQEPIDLRKNASTGRQSASTTPASVPASLSSHTASPSPSNATPASPQRSTASNGASSVAEQFREQVKRRAEQERREKEEKARKEKEEKERLEKEQKEKEQKEQADKEKQQQKAAESEVKAVEPETVAEPEPVPAAAEKEVQEPAKAAESAEPTEPKESSKETQEAEAPREPREPKEPMETVQEAPSAPETPRKDPTKALAEALKAPRLPSEQIYSLVYPSNIKRSEARSNDNSKYIYDLDFLMQFQPVINFPPTENWDLIRSAIQSGKDDKRSFSKGSSRGPMRNSSMGSQSAMGSFSSGGGFRGERSASGVGGFGMGGNKGIHRMASSSNLSKNGRQGSRRRNERSNSSRGGDHDDKPEAPAVPMPARSANAWVPRSRAAAAEQTDDGRLAPDVVQRKVNSLLNKMTLENFDRISDQILEVAAQSKHETDGRTLRQVIELTFAKAVDESHWSNMYARFCAKMMSNVDPEIQDESIVDGKGEPVKGGALFRKYLLNKCQEEFEKGWSDKLPTNPDGSTIDAEVMSDEYYKAVAAKRRGLGLIRFVGELFILNLISEKIIHACLTKLVSSDDPSEEVIESLCQLMITVGSKIDAKPATAKYVNAYFERMAFFQSIPGLPSRLRFKLMDVADLRDNNWQDKNKDKGPKKLSEIHEEAKVKAAEDAARMNSRSRSHRGNDRGSNFTTMAGDLSRIGRIRSHGGGQTLGPSSMLNREGSGSSRRSMNSSPGTPLSKEGSRNPSQSGAQSSSSSARVNMFEHLNEDEDKKEKEKEKEPEKVEAAPAQAPKEPEEQPKEVAAPSEAEQTSEKTLD